MVVSNAINVSVSSQTVPKGGGGILYPPALAAYVNGLAVTVTIDNSRSGAVINGMSVDWKDGSGAQDVPVDTGSVTHNYAAGGKYNINVTVYDNAGGVAIGTVQAVAVGPGAQSNPWDYTTGYHGAGWYSNIPGNPGTTYISSQTQYGTYSVAGGNGSQLYPYLPQPDGTITWKGAAWYDLTYSGLGAAAGVQYIDSQDYINVYNSNLKAGFLIYQG